MVADHVNKKHTIELIKVSRAEMQDLLNTLELPERGAKWEIKPDFSTVTVGTFNWLKCDEDHEDNRKAITFLRETNESRKITGTAHVVIVTSESLTNEILRNNVKTLSELKKPQKLESKDHTPQVIGEHFAASYLNRRHPVVSVLTDLNNSWTFYWYAQADDGEMALFKLKLSGEKAETEAKYILDNLYDNDNNLQEKSLPLTFSRRLSFEKVFVNWVIRNTSKHGREEEEENIDDDDDHSPVRRKKSRNRMGNGKNSQPSSSNSRVSSSGSGETSHSNNQYNASMSLASTLSLFAPPSSRDIANELDLLDMLDENEQFEIVRSFAMKHVVPYMKG